MKAPIHNALRACTALMVLAAAAMVTVPAAASPTEPAAELTQVHALDGHRVTLDVFPAAGPLRGAAILSHGFTRSRRTLAGHAQALADAGVLALTPDLPCTFDFRCNARALGALVSWLRASGTFGPPVEKVMLVGFSAGGLSSQLAADTPGVVGFIGLDPFDRAMPDEAEHLGLAAAGRLRTEVLLLRAPPSRCNAEAAAAPCRLACGNAEPARQQQVRQGLMDAASRWMPCAFGREGYWLSGRADGARKSIRLHRIS